MAPHGLTPAEESQAQQLQGMSHTQRQQALGLDRDAQNAAFMREHNIAPAGTATPAAPSRMQRFMRPVGRGLALAGLAGAGALAYGMHRQNQQDQDARNLVYAPMQGTF
jgi:hypothetical protein